MNGNIYILMLLKLLMTKHHHQNPKKSKEIQLTVFKNASHGSNLTTRLSVTGIIIFHGHAPIKFYSKRENTVETSTYGAELVAFHLAVEQLLDIRNKLRMMGIKVEKTSQILGDNKAVIMNMQLPSSTLKKKHNSIAFHKSREAIAAGICQAEHINGN